MLKGADGRESPGGAANEIQPLCDLGCPAAARDARGVRPRTEVLAGNPEMRSPRM